MGKVIAVRDVNHSIKQTWCHLALPLIGKEFTNKIWHLCVQQRERILGWGSQ